MIRKMLIAANLIALLLIAGIAIDMRWRYADIEQYIGVGLSLLLPILNILYMWKVNKSSGRNLVGLYIERRRLEEEALIAKLKIRASE